LARGRRPHRRGGAGFLVALAGLRRPGRRRAHARRAGRPANGRAPPAVRRLEGVVAPLTHEPSERRVVLRPARTHGGPKEGRLRLMREVDAQLEPLFFLYEGEPPARRPDREPDIEVEGARLWRLPPDGIQKAFADRQLLIADGHHRYETA